MTHKIHLHFTPYSIAIFSIVEGGGSQPLMEFTFGHVHAEWPVQWDKLQNGLEQLILQTVNGMTIICSECNYTENTKLKWSSVFCIQFYIIIHPFCMGPIVFSMVLDPSNKMKRSYLHASLFSDFDITIFFKQINWKQFNFV